MSASQAQLTWPLQKPQQLVYIELGSDNGGMMLGICEQGLSFRAVSPLRAEGPIQFTLALDGKTRLQGVGEIVWSEEGGKTGGLKFTNVSAQFRESVRTWLSSEATPKNVGREVTPAAALPLDTISKLKSDIRSIAFKETAPDVPLRPAEEKPLEARPAEQIQPKQTALEIEAPPLKPAPPKIEQERVEEKPEPVALVEPERSGPIVPEPELRTLVPLPSEQPQADPVFSLPNFRLPSATFAPVPAEETAPTPEKISPVVSPPAVPPPELSLPEPSLTQSKAVLLEIEAPASPQEIPLPHFVAEDLVQESPRLNRVFAAGIIGLALAIILAAIVLSFRRDVGAALIYLGEKLAGEEHKRQQPIFTVAPAQTSQSNAVPAEKSADKPAPSPDALATSQTQSSATSNQPSDTNSAIGNTLSSSPVSLGDVQRVQDLPPPTDADTGQKEFEQARAILKGNHRQRDLSYAVHLLWAGVGKGYVPAEVTLADLYARGDGVAKSCEQARTLLEAAVRKGSHEGRLRLDQLKRRGCR
jgi:hypothetical protein